MLHSNLVHSLSLRSCEKPRVTKSGENSRLSLTNAARSFRSLQESVSRHFAIVALVGLLGFASAHAAESVTYEYDALGRLDKVIRVNGSNTVTIEYDYDAAGNRTQRTVSGGAPPPPPNNPPNAVNDASTAPYLYATTYVNVTANDSDPDGDPLTVTAVTQPNNAAVSIHSSSTIRLVALNSGTSSMSYTVSDGNGGTDTATLTYTVPSGGGNPFNFNGGSDPDEEGSTNDAGSEDNTEVGE